MRQFFIFSFLIILLYSCKTEYVQQSVSKTPCKTGMEKETLSLQQQLERIPEYSPDKTGVYIIEEGEDALLTRAWLSAKAEKTMDIQYFIFYADNVGTIAMDYILKAADRGVKVRLIIDDLLVDAHPNDLLALNAHKNINIKIYNPNVNIGKHIGEKISNMVVDFRGINQRMHNKTFTVDGRVCITGGRNIEDAYFDYDRAYNYRDRDILLVGQAAEEVEKSFEEFWESDLSVDVDRLIKFSIPDFNIDFVYNRIHNYACNMDNFWPQIRHRINDVPYKYRDIIRSGKFLWVDDVTFISDIPGKNQTKKGLGGSGKTTEGLMALFNSAQESIYIQTPYLVTTDVGKTILKKTIDRGVSITILTNSLCSTDNKEAFSGYQRNRKALLKMGVNIYEYKPDAAIRKKLIKADLQRQIEYFPIFGLHSKSMVIDDSITVVSTFNLDPRSANLNTECYVAVKSKEITAFAKEIMIEELQPENSWHTTLDSNPDHHAGMSKRFKTWIRRVVPKSIL